TSCSWYGDGVRRDLDSFPTRRSSDRAGENFRTVLAESAESALAKLASERPEVVLVDAALDGVNGYDLCARVKATAPRTAVILLRSEEHTSELQSRENLVCRLLLEEKK